MVCSVADAAGDSDAGGVDEHVEPSVGLDVLCDEPRAVVLVLDVGCDRLGVELARGRLEPLELARSQRQVVALLAEHAGDRKADPRRATGDEGARARADALHSPARTLEAMSATDGLTSLAKAGGCAAKYSAARLEQLLEGLVPAEATDLLVGLDPADDAAVYRLDDQTALVFTVDFFPPVVDDPRAFGRIAATNALNDVFAMGGRPLLALSVTAFPEELPVAVLGEVLAGAAEATREAGAILAGGHTIRDDEPKYGLAVVGTVHPDGIWRKSTRAAR